MESETDLFRALKFRELNQRDLQPGDGRPSSNGSSSQDLAARLEKAIKEAKSLDSDDSDLPSLQLEIGSLHSRLGAIPQARLWLERSLTTARSLDDKIIAGRALVA